MSAELVIAVVSMVIACVAFFVTGTQLSQQLFGTAEGFRRCQATIIGKWYDLVRLRWRWSSFRFETIVTTPHFSILDSSPDAAKDQSTVTLIPHSMVRGAADAIPITGSYLSRRDTLSLPASRPGDERDEMVSWLSLLDKIHALQELQLMSGPQAAVWLASRGTAAIPMKKTLGDHPPIDAVVMKFKQRSWDLMPADLIKPLATTDLGTLIVLAHRLGMSWREIHPSESRMYAEGNGQSFSASDVKGLGIVVRYSTERNDRLKQREEDVLDSLRIPSKDADKMGCGIIPGNTQLKTFDLHLTGSSGTDIDLDLLSSALQKVDLYEPAVEAILSSVTRNDGPNRLPGFSDLPSIWSPWLPLPSSPIVSVLSPLRARIPAVLESIDAVNIFRAVLARESASSRTGSLPPQRAWVLSQLQDWHAAHGDKLTPAYQAWLGRHGGNGSERLADYTRFLKQIFDATTAFFVRKEADWEPPPRSWRVDDGFFRELVRCHVEMASRSVGKARVRFEAQTCVAGSLGVEVVDGMVAERAVVYTEDRNWVTSTMAFRGFPGDEAVEDAWWMLLLRGLVWGQSIVRLPPEAAAPVPSYLYGSTTPVYIT